jgi:hypothetical protein
MLVEFLTYNKQKYPVRLSYRVFKGLKQDLGKINPEQLQTLDPAILETMLWYGLVSGHKAEGKELALKKGDMEDMLEECWIDFLKIIPKFFPNAKTGNVLPNLEKESLTDSDLSLEKEQEAAKTSSTEITS